MEFHFSSYSFQPPHDINEFVYDKKEKEKLKHQRMRHVQHKTVINTCLGRPVTRKKLSFLFDGKLKERQAPLVILKVSQGKQTSQFQT